MCLRLYLQPTTKMAKAKDRETACFADVCKLKGKLGKSYGTYLQ